MLETIKRPEQLQVADQESPTGVRPSNTRLWLYLTPILAVPVLLLVFALLILPTNWFLAKAGASFPYLLNTGSGATMNGDGCEVVIYGDSTAMFALNPLVIEQRTGLKTCNIADIEGETIVNDTMILDQFLARNARPRFIVFQYTPEGMNPQALRADPIVTRFEAVTYRMRQPHRLASLVVLMKHPEDIFSWTEHGMLVAIESLFTKTPKHQGKPVQYRPMGQIMVGARPLVSCTYKSYADHPDKAWVNSLRSRYAKNGTTVIVDAMALPECDPDIAYFRRELAGLIDNQIQTLPVTDYYVGGRHVNMAGSVPVSNMVAEQILQHLKPTP